MNRKKSHKSESAASPKSQPASSPQPTMPSKARDSQSKTPILQLSRTRQIWFKTKAAARTSLMALIIASPFVTYISCYRWSLKPVQFTVDRRERIVKGSGDSTQSYYLVWSQEGEVFTVNDSWSFMTWNSSDRYGQLHEGAKIHAQVAGWRIPFLSWYRNVIEIESIENRSIEHRAVE